MRRAHKRLNVWLMLTSILILLSFLYATRPSFQEYFALRRLSSADDRGRESALEELARIGTAKSILPLVNFLAANEGNGIPEPRNQTTRAVQLILQRSHEAGLLQLRSALSSGDWRVRKAACICLADYGHPAEMVLEALVTIARKDSAIEVRGYALHALAATGGDAGLAVVGAALKEREDSVRRSAAGALARAGDRSLVFLEALLEQVDRTPELVEAWVALAAIGAPAVPGILSVLKRERDLSGTRIIISAASECLRSMQDPAKEIVRQLVEVLQEAQSADQKTKMIEILAKIGEEPSETFSVIESELICRGDRKVRRAAAEAMCLIAASAWKSPEGREAALDCTASVERDESQNELRRVAAALNMRRERLLAHDGHGCLIWDAFEREESLVVKYAILRAIRELGEASRELVRGIMGIGLNRQMDPLLRSSALQIVPKMRQVDTEVLLELLNCFVDRGEDHDIRWAAMGALKATAEGKGAIVPGLMRIVEGADYGVEERRAALHAIGAVGDEAVTAMRPLMRIFRDTEEDYYVASAALWAVSEIGRESEELVPFLIGVMGDSEFEVHHGSIATMMGSLGEAAKPALAVLLECFADKRRDWVTRTSCLGAIGELESAAAEVTGELAEMLCGETMDRWETEAVITALGFIGPAAVSAVPALLDVVRRGDWTSLEPAYTEVVVVTSQMDVVASALRGMGGGATPALIRALDDKSMRVREVALAALEMMPEGAAAAVPRLSELVRDPWEEERLKVMAKETIRMVVELQGLDEADGE